MNNTFSGGERTKIINGRERGEMEGVCGGILALQQQQHKTAGANKSL